MKRKDLLKDVMELLQRMQAMKSYSEESQNEAHDEHNRKLFEQLYTEEHESFIKWLEEEVEFPSKENVNE